MTENDYDNEKIKCENNKTLLDELSQSGISTFVSYNATLKETIKTRIGSVFEDSTNNANAMTALWRQRDDNRQTFLEKKNTSLQFLLFRTKEALEKQQDAEDEASGKKPAKGKKK